MRYSTEIEGYTLLDSGDKKRLETWGEYAFVRPDPQILWPKGENKRWDSPDAVYFRSEKGGGQWDYKNEVPSNIIVSFRDIKFSVRPTGFKHMGLFPEQATNWEYIINKINSSARKLNVLNMFAYTGGATLAAASAGANVCHVDASKGMVQWARDNATLSGMGKLPIRWIVDDCIKFVNREIRRGRKYDIIILDPPSYGRGTDGQLWTLEDKLYELLLLCAQVLSDTPVLVMINTYTTGLTGAVMAHMLGKAMGKIFGTDPVAEEIGIKVCDSGLILPAGNTAIIECEDKK